MRASVFIATSLDGFIARPDGSLDWLPGDETLDEDHGYDAFIASVDVVIIGRGTYETVLAFPKWPYKPDLAVRVLSSRPLSIPAALPPTVETMSGPPADILASLESQGFQHAYVDGGKTIQGFLAARLIQRMTLTQIPVLLGRGIPLFGLLPGDLRFSLVKTRALAGGLVQSVYEVAILP